jgi:hypothetical protein
MKIHGKRRRQEGGSSRVKGNYMLVQAIIKSSPVYEVLSRGVVVHSEMR